MTPQERQLIDDLFDRLAKLESAKRDPEAMSAIMQGLRNAPNAVYALVQTALVQDEALKRADARIQELEAGAGQRDQGQSGGFLDSMRDAIFGQNQSHGSVPNVRAPEIAGGSRPAWNTGQVLQQNQPPGQFNQPAYGQPNGGAQQQPSAFGGGGSSFLGTAAAAAVGVVGGSMLAGSLRSMMGGGGNHQASATPETIMAGSRTADRLAISPAAAWRARPGSTTSARRQAGAPTTTMIAARGRAFLILPRTTTTTWTTIPTASTATMGMATAITREQCRS